VMQPDNKDSVKVIDLTKTHDNGFPAVREISFGAEPNHIFGLLGPNGAGKSTTFNVITAMIPRTSGSVRLNDTEIDKNLFDIFQKVGVCPQYNCLYTNLTVREHLELFGKIKGLEGKDLDDSVDYFMQSVKLKESGKQAGILSQGNKRKLCFANALVGGPSILFLDEPSTGLDPIAKKYLWHTLNQTLHAKKASITFTTHSIAEAESLCHKIGIMVNGKYVCLGSTQHLKNKYGSGYKITLKKVIDNPASLEAYMEECFGNAVAKLVDSNGLNETYQIPLLNFSFQKSFKYLDQIKEEGKILDFSISNTTLEQIFLQFSKYQTSAVFFD